MLLFFAVVSAGCVLPEEPVQTESVEVPSDLDIAMEDFVSDLKKIDLSLTIDIYTLASKIGSLDTYAEIEAVGREYYSHNSWIERIVYYDSKNGKFLYIPNQYVGQLTDSVTPMSEQMFLESGGLIQTSCVQIEGTGFVEIWYAAVYDDSGAYTGYVAFVYDWYEAFTEHDAAGSGLSYGDCVAFLCSDRNSVLYSSKPEYAGQTFSAEKPLKTKETLIVPQTASYGAYTYLSQPFYVYNQDAETKKITSWERFPFHNGQYTLYLTKETDPVVLNTTEIFTRDVNMTENVLDAFLYSSDFGFSALAKRVSEGYYSTPMYVIGPDGTVVAAPEYDKVLVGLSFLNARDSYDSAYVEKAMYAARQGGGYIKYLFPVDGTVSPEACQFSISYVNPLGENGFIFGYTSGDTRLLPVNHELKSNVVLVSRALVESAHERGVGTLAELVMSVPNASGSMFVRDANYETDNIVILDYAGQSYADTQHPSLVGQSLTFYTDALYMSITRTAIMLAKSGGGVMYDFQKSAGTEGQYDLWLYSVEPVNDEYFVLYGTIVHTIENSTITGL